MVTQNSINASPTNHNTLAWGASGTTNIAPGTSSFILKSNGISATPSYQTFPTLTLSVVTQVFTGSGTYTPTTGMRWCEIEVAGGGGSGGLINAATTSAAAAGGGASAGGYAKGIYYNTTIGTSQTVSIGAGGNSSGGGTTSVGALISATGGTQGTTGTVSTGFGVNASVAGGIGTGGSIQTRGAPGHIGLAIPAAVFGTDGFSAGGYGGFSVYGGNGRSSSAVAASGNGVGTAAVNYASGGSGARSINSASTSISGGNGSAGIVVITEWCFT